MRPYESKELSQSLGPQDLWTRLRAPRTGTRARVFLQQLGPTKLKPPHQVHQVRQARRCRACASNVTLVIIYRLSTLGTRPTPLLHLTTTRIASQDSQVGCSTSRASHSHFSSATTSHIRIGYRLSPPQTTFAFFGIATGSSVNPSHRAFTPHNCWTVQASKYKHSKRQELPGAPGSQERGVRRERHGRNQNWAGLLGQSVGSTGSPCNLWGSDDALADVLQGGGGVNNTLHLPAPRLLAASVRLPAAFRCVMPVTISTAALSRDRASGTTSAWSSGGRLSPDRLPVHAHLAAVTRQHAPGTGVVSHRAAMTTSRRFGPLGWVGVNGRIGSGIECSCLVAATLQCKTNTPEEAGSRLRKAPSSA
ncbi:hypothetical protein A1Q1_01648 [Trichosporon asahii var. asahii CBS 2479]|nr:hypothetical protein A1Q1_01648 [Trichosporon asahii var. asahii CBS 2479]EJT49248.1 hypothetical protein A1Q1_01648 [Trichosporon asahii var. asahii CBS 2479]